MRQCDNAQPPMRTFILILLSAFCVAAEAQDFVLEKLPAPFNSEYDEINPVPSRDGNTLFFTRVGYPDFCKTLVMDSVDQAAKLSTHELIDLIKLGGRQT